MFTGLVEGIGQVSGINRRRGDMILSVVPLFDMSDVKIGEPPIPPIIQHGGKQVTIDKFLIDGTRSFVN